MTKSTAGTTPTRAEIIRRLAFVTHLPLVEAAQLDFLIEEIWSSGLLEPFRDGDVALYATLGEVSSTASVHDREGLRQSLAKVGHVSAGRVAEPAPPGYVYVAVSASKRQATVCISVDGQRTATAQSEVN